MEIRISEEERGLRLDKFLRRHFKEISLSEIYQMIKNGDILINKKIKNPDYRLQENDIIFTPFDTNKNHQETEIPEKFLQEIEILYLDDFIAIVEKPYGIPVHSGSGWNFGFFNIVEKQLDRIYPLHRLDKDTSGIIMFARKRSIAISLSQAFKEHSITRKYLALVKGTITKPGEISKPLIRAPKKVILSEDGKKAITTFSPIKTTNCCSLIELKLLTGRTHQIRVHMAKMNHPIAGDWKYGNREFNITIKKLGLKRLFLHSWKIAFNHPITGEYIELTSPLPIDLKKVLKRIS